MLQPDSAGVQSDLAAGVCGAGFGPGPSDQGLPGSPQAIVQVLGPPGLDGASMFAGGSMAYCKQEISAGLNAAVAGLLTSIKGFQDRAMAKNPAKANMRRWYVCGLREVRKAIKSGKARAVLLAPNIEQIEAEGGLNDSVDDIIASCGAASVPVVFALSRKKMGEVYGFRKRMSAIALLEVGGVQEVFDQVLSLAAEGRSRQLVG
ncbi:hypothetical protein OEZ86_006024 [Tetradesmus obliquus]|nr:hypothetical protein OEZ86_006024 [Tetradesmus obliquus]